MQPWREALAAAPFFAGTTDDLTDVRRTLERLEPNAEGSWSEYGS